MSEVADILDGASRILAGMGAWTRGELARDESGRFVPPTDPRAICWCAAGAIHRAAGYERRAPDSVRDLTASALHRAELLTGRVLAGWNDAPERYQAEVVAMLSRAAKLSRAEGR